MDDLKEKRLSYTRVSEIIGKQTERQMRSIPIDRLINASEKGTIIHGYCTSHLRNLFIPQYEEEYQSYINEFIRWCNENVSKVIFSEKRLYDDKNQITGQPDALVVLTKSKQTALVDIKTSANPSISWPVQLASYKDLCEINGYRVDLVLNLHLKKIKNSKLSMRNKKDVVHVPSIIKAIEIPHEDLTPYQEIFASALKCYRYFEAKELNDAIL